MGSGIRATPLVLTAVDPQFVSPELLPTNTTLVTQKADLCGFLQDTLQMKPETRHIAVVFGSSAVERAWLEECRREFARFSCQGEFIWFDQLPLDQLLTRCAKLPPDAFIFHALSMVHAAALPLEKNEALRRLHQTANATVFGLFEREFGQGLIGGRLHRHIDVGERSG